VTNTPVAIEVVLGAPTGLEVEPGRCRRNDIGSRGVPSGTVLSNATNRRVKALPEIGFRPVDRQTPLDAGGTAIGSVLSAPGSDGLPDDALGGHDHLVPDPPAGSATQAASWREKAVEVDEATGKRPPARYNVEVEVGAGVEGGPVDGDQQASGPTHPSCPVVRRRRR